MFNPFRQVLVYKDIRSGCNVVYWRMDKDIRYSPNAILSVEYARAGGPWQILAPDVRNTCLYIDNRATNFNKINNDTYRLCLRLSDNQVYYSQPQMLRWLDMQSQGKVNNLFRLAYKEMAMTGRHGHLLKRKQWGQRCPMCTDLPGDSSVNQHCPCCFGTGYKGGYYDGIPLDILQQQEQLVQGIEQIGAVQASTLQAKMLAWPYIGLGDVWVDDATDQRYYIQHAVVASKFKSVPLIYHVTMHLLQCTDIMHSTQADRKLDMYTTADWDKEFDSI